MSFYKTVERFKLNKEFGQIPVAVLGATGLVGQKAIALIDRHPLFYVNEVAASDFKVGQKYGEAVCWKEEEKISKFVFNLPLKKSKEIESQYILSALPKDAAKEIEPFHANRGAFVFSNASAFRMDPSVPILIPEVNLEHLSLLDNQKSRGKIITNSNCAVAFICLALKPLMSLGDITNVSVVTLQAISGAGSFGVDSLDITGNIIPYIANEEEKIVLETKKILGTASKPALFDITANANRVPVLHGHTAILHIHFDRDIKIEKVKETYLSLNCDETTYQIYDDPHHPQPRNVKAYDQSVHIGRIKQGPKKNILGLIAMGNNLVRGAAGASLKNMEVIACNQMGISK